MVERSAGALDLVEPKVRRAWMVAGGIVSVLMLAYGTLEVIGVIAREDRTVRQQFDAAGVKVVDVSSDDGNVTVVGDAESQIRVIIRLQESWRKVERTAKVVGDRLVLSASCPSFGTPICSADYEVHVPSGVRVVTSSDNGDTSVRDVDGGAHLRSNNGDLTATALGGTVTLVTDNGTVEGIDLQGDRVTTSSDNGDVVLTFSRAPQSASAISDNGDIEVVVPRGDEMWKLDAATDNGDIRTPIRTDPSASRRLVARSDNGDVVVRYP